MTIKSWYYVCFILVDYQTGLVTSLYSHDIILFYFNELSNRIIREKNIWLLQTGASLSEQDLGLSKGYFACDIWRNGSGIL